MDKKTILIASAGIVGVAVIGSAIYLVNHNKNNDSVFQHREEIIGKKAKVDNTDPDLELIMLGADERYRFCLGEEKISGDLTSSVAGLGQEQGQLVYTTKEVALFDTQRNKLVILARSIDYKYNGSYGHSTAIGSGQVIITENGLTYEYYSQNKAPLRIDFGANLFFPAPKRKTTDWVSVNEVMRGEAMGVSDARSENSLGDARIVCAPASLGEQIDSKSDNFSYSGSCLAPEVVSGVNFSGQINYNCQFVEAETAIEVVKNYLELEKNPNAKKNQLEEATNQEEEMGAIKNARTGTENNLKAESSSDYQEELQKNSELLREEGKDTIKTIGDDVEGIKEDIQKLLEKIEVQ